MVTLSIEPANSNLAVFRDSVLPFQLGESDVTGRFFRSQKAITQILERHNYPEPIARLLGEALLVIGLIGSGLKLQHRLILQLQGDGAISMIMAEYTSHNQMRGYVKYDAEQFERWTGGEDINPFLLLGKGHVAITVDNGPNMRPYQGIVPIDGKSLSAVLLKYIEQSDQIMSSLSIHLDKISIGDDKFSWRGSAMLLQKLGKAGDDFKVTPVDNEQEENWTRVCTLFHTVGAEEMLDPLLSEEDLLYRLFHEEKISVFERKDVEFGCSCSEEKLKDFLKTMPEAERKEMVNTDDGFIHADCQMCNAIYRFSLDDIK